MYRSRAGRAAVLSLAVLVLFSGILTGCGKERRTALFKTGAEAEYGNGYEESYAPAYAPEPAYDSNSDYMYEAKEAAAEETALSSLSASGALRTPENTSDKLIYSGSLRLQTLEYEKTMQSIHDKIESAGGFVQYEDESDGNDSWYYDSASVSRRYAQIEARIPSKEFQGFMESLQEDGKIMNRHVNVDNITQSYAETEASVKAYEIEQERLLDMMDKAETIEDMIAVEARLSEVEAELGRYKTSLSSMDRDVEYSAVSISVDEVREYTEEPDDSTFLSRLKETVKSSWSGFLWFMEELLYVVIRLVPFLAVIAVIILIVRAVRKKTSPRRQAKKEAKAQKKVDKAMKRLQDMQAKNGEDPEK